MKFATSESGASSQAFTLAEVLAALVFMAIVIPVAVQGLRTASLAGEVAERKATAARIAERVLNESLVSTNWSQATQVGAVTEGYQEFKWTLQSEPWDQTLTNQLPLSVSTMNQVVNAQPRVDQYSAMQIQMNRLTVEVTYAVQNRDYSVRLSTLVNWP